MIFFIPPVLSISMTEPRQKHTPVLVCYLLTQEGPSDTMMDIQRDQYALSVQLFWTGDAAQRQKYDEMKRFILRCKWKSALEEETTPKWIQTRFAVCPEDACTAFLDNCSHAELIELYEWANVHGEDGKSIWWPKIAMDGVRPFDRKKQTKIEQYFSKET